MTHDPPVSTSSRVLILDDCLLSELEDELFHEGEYDMGHLEL